MLKDRDSVMSTVVIFQQVTLLEQNYLFILY